MSTTFHPVPPTRRRLRRRSSRAGGSRTATRSGAESSTVKPGSRSCMPSTRPSTVLAIGPTVSSVGRPVARRRVTRGRSSSSAPRPRSTRPGCAPSRRCRCRARTSASSFATATAEPLDEPPGIRLGSSGFTGVPNHGFTPSAPKASSTRLVFPTIRASAARARRGRRRRPRPAAAAGQVLAAGGGRHAGHVDEVLDREPWPVGAARIQVDG